MRIRPTHYSFQEFDAAACSLSLSTDGTTLVEVDRQARPRGNVKIPLSPTFECCSVVLMSLGGSAIQLRAFEVYGTLLVPPTVSLPRMGECVQCPLGANPRSDGIIGLLARTFRVDLHEVGRVVVSTNSSCYWKIPWLMPDSPGSWFESENKPGQAITWFFRQNKIWLTHYAIHGGRAFDPKSWRLEGGLTLSAMAVLHEATDNTDLAGSQSVAAFAVAEPCECRYVRLSQTGPNQNGDNRLGFWRVEFFGSVTL
jgi:hypothetical protein